MVEPFAGGRGAFLVRLAIGLARQGVEVVCYASEGSSIPGVEIRTCGVAKGVLAPPHPPHMMNGTDMLAIQAQEDVVMHSILEEVRKDLSFDLLHNHSSSTVPF